MKLALFLVPVLAVVSTTQAFAADITLVGRDASNLMHALHKAGATSRREVERRVYTVSGVRLGSSAGHRGPVRFSVEMRDDVSGKVVRAREEAKDLFVLLNHVGVKVTNRAGGRSMEASLIVCKTGSIPGKPGSCRISD